VRRVKSAAKMLAPCPCRTLAVRMCPSGEACSTSCPSSCTMLSQALANRNYEVDSLNLSVEVKKG